MKKDTFPMNYFKSVMTPIRVFNGRKQLNWFQIIILLLFLNGLMMIPLSINIAKMDSYPVEETYPGAFELLDESVIDALEDAEYSQGKLTLPNNFYFEMENGIVGGNVSELEKENAKNAENTLLFQENELIIKESSNPITTVAYTNDFSIEEITTVEELKTELSRQWFIQNKSFIVGSLLISLSTLLLVSIVVISLGSSLFVLLTKKGQISTIQTYKESVNLVVNSLGIPTLVAMLIGLIQFNIITMIMIQTFGFIIMLLIVFMKTRFSDDYMDQLNTLDKKDN
ncbi:DUF1189 family protein [Paucisalibacillus globulus]|uniref:DUF1189 family protein n=1 Tax=Paucisalibacillus globulus TaxID=351095 RepID=UPI00055A8745|nr:DUF1189 family protein [Paucisalibacillus globulus]